MATPFQRRLIADHARKPVVAKKNNGPFRLFFCNLPSSFLPSHYTSDGAYFGPANLALRKDDACDLTLHAWSMFAAFSQKVTY